MRIQCRAADRSLCIDGMRVNPTDSQQLRNHSPDGFNWGYGGSGPAQLALAILLASVGRRAALLNYQRFKFEVVAAWPQGQDVDVSIDLTPWGESQLP